MDREVESQRVGGQKSNRVCNLVISVCAREQLEKTDAPASPICLSHTEHSSAPHDQNYSHSFPLHVTFQLCPLFAWAFHSAGHSNLHLVIPDYIKLKTGPEFLIGRPDTRHLAAIPLKSNWILSGWTRRRATSCAGPTIFLFYTTEQSLTWITSNCPQQQKKELDAGRVITLFILGSVGPCSVRLGVAWLLNVAVSVSGGLLPLWWSTLLFWDMS